MVDCSHGNCGKRYERQLDVVREIARQIEHGSRRVFGAMIESHIHPGAQKFTPGRDDPASLRTA
jgi:3-deoxy-7-phosphoheptulonate synthase